MNETSKVYVRKGDQTHGPYSPAQVRSYLLSGQIASSDLAFFEGAAEWVQLYTIPEMQVTLPSAQRSSTNWPAANPGMPQSQPTGGMSGSQKFTWGLVLGFTAMFLLLGGLVLSATGIGACVGVPMALVGLPLGIWGGVWAYQGRAQILSEAVAKAVAKGTYSGYYAASQQQLPAQPGLSPQQPWTQQLPADQRRLTDQPQSAGESQSTDQQLQPTDQEQPSDEDQPSDQQSMSDGISAQPSESALHPRETES